MNTVTNYNTYKHKLKNTSNIIWGSLIHCQLISLMMVLFHAIWPRMATSLFSPQ